ncbi:MAG: tetratricopeptide repeat protein [Cyclobacteriaceae bacterium]
MRITCLFLFWLTAYIAFSQHTENQTNVYVYYKQGVELFNDQQYEDALFFFNKYIESDESIRTCAAHYYQALSLYHLGRTDAKQHLLRFTENCPTYSKQKTVYYYLGKLAFKDTLYQEAIAYFYQSDRDENAPDEQPFLTAYSYLQLGDTNTSEKLFSEAAQLAGKYGSESNYYLAAIAFAQHNYKKALRILGKSKVTSDKTGDLKVSILYQLKRYQEVIDFIVGYKGQKPKNMLLLYAESHYELGNYHDAANAYNKYTEKNKVTDRDLKYRIAFANHATDKYITAANFFKEVALKEDTIGHYAAYYLSQIYLRDKNPTFAEGALKTAVDMKVVKEIQETALLDHAKLSISLEKYRFAIEELKQVIDSSSCTSDREEAKKLISKALYNTEDYKQTTDYIERTTHQSKSLLKLYQKVTYAQAIESVQHTDFETAEAYFDKSLAHSFDNTIYLSALQQKGDLLSLQSLWSEALPLYEKVITISSPRTFQNHAYSYYGMGYCLFNTQNFKESLTNFLAYIKEAPQNSELEQDAYLRIADLYLSQKKYAKSDQFYSKAIAISPSKKDYALLQRARIYGIQKDRKRAIQTYNSLIKDFPSSIYVDDAYYYKGELLFQDNEFQQAISLFDYFIKTYPSSPLIPHAYLRRGLSHYNLTNYKKAQADYDVILTDYCLQPIALEALESSKLVSLATTNNAAYTKRLDDYESCNPNNDVLEKKRFESAKELYYGYQLDQTITSVQSFFVKYPNSRFKEELNFYLADTYYQKGELKTAKLYFNKVSKINYSFSDVVYSRLGAIHTADSLFPEAISNYKTVLSITESQKKRQQALLGVMKGYEAIDKPDSSNQYATLLLSEFSELDYVRNVAWQTMAKNAYQKGDSVTAYTTLQQLIEQDDKEYAVEALYTKSKWLYMEKEYNLSLETLFSLNENFSSKTTWVGKSYLLIAQNYIVLGEFLQAKATLKSLIDYFPEETIKREAQIRLNDLEINNE